MYEKLQQAPVKCSILVLHPGEIDPVKGLIQLKFYAMRISVDFHIDT